MVSVMLYLYVLGCSATGYVCFVCCVSDSVCELFRNNSQYVRVLLFFCVSRCSFHMFCLCFCMSEVIS